MNKKIFNLGMAIGVLSILLFPLIAEDFGTASKIFMDYMPVVVFLSALFSGYKYGKTILFPVGISCAYFISTFIYYSPSEIVYIFVYFILALVGNNLGEKFNRNIKK